MHRAPVPHAQLSTSIGGVNQRHALPVANVRGIVRMVSLGTCLIAVMCNAYNCYQVCTTAHHDVTHTVRRPCAGPFARHCTVMCRMRL